MTNNGFSFYLKFKEEKGAVAVVVALLLIGIVGMLAYVIDTGSIYQERGDLQSVADAAALAGVQELPENPAIAVQTAIDYADVNGFEIFPSDITVTQTFVENDTIVIRAVDVDRPLFFAGVIGRDTVTVGATATAIIGSPAKVSGIVPWGFTSNNYTPGTEYTLKYGSPPEPGPGNFGALRIDGGGASVYRDTIINGSTAPLSTGQWLNPETGNMSGPTRQGTGDRIYQQENNAMDSFGILTEQVGNVYELIQPDSQYIIVPWVTSFGNGSDPVQILGFMQFVITYAQGSVVKAKFINKAILQSDEDIDGIDGSGLRVIRLID
ncbi:MAG: hypothetical protein FJW66_00325 [Actinobacteria bacterium]|nr:hypothetical protein [Actinomycetota bacterium]